jgi:hypothetical protein
VREKTGKSTSAIYADMAKGMFPPGAARRPRRGMAGHEVGAWIGPSALSATPPRLWRRHQFMNFVSTKKSPGARVRGPGKSLFKIRVMFRMARGPMAQYLST